MDEHVFVIAIGDAFDGITLWADEQGQPFASAEEAQEAAEIHLTDETWHLVAINAIADYKTWH